MGSLIGVLMLVGFLAKFWWLIAIAGIATVVWTYVLRTSARQQASLDAEGAEKTAAAARAGQQHAWVLADDDRSGS